MTHKHEHDWIVFSTALADVCLMVQCGTCGAYGTVHNPTREEWSEAFHAPSNPYAWTQPERVVVRETPTAWKQ